MIEQAELKKLTNYIEENTRASESSGITFIDPRNFKSRSLNKQNHVIFGRRGAGKTSLINAIRKFYADKFIVTYTNLEDFKDISFPNILIHVLNSFFGQISYQIKKDTPWYKLSRKIKSKKLRRKIKKSIHNFQNKIGTPDQFNEQVIEKKSGETNKSLNAQGKGLAAEFSGKKMTHLEKNKTLTIDKLDLIKNSIPQFKYLIKKISKFYNSKPIFLILDDFYFLKKSSQPFFVDFFHRISKDTMLFLKIATIRNRSKFYIQTQQSYIGTEMGHDIQEIDLDYSLDRFEDLKSFMNQLLAKACKESNAEIDINKLLSPNAFTQLCLASGGVPRDFLTLFNKLCNLYEVKGYHRLTKLHVNEVAIANIENKLSSLRIDSAEEKEILELYLSYIKDFVIIQRKTNIFLVPNEELNSYPQIKQAIKELVDLRMIHLVEPNTSSAPSDGKRYSAYMLDIGLYPNSQPRDFKQLEPGAMQRTGLRSAPKLRLDELSAYVNEYKPQEFLARVP